MGIRDGETSVYTVDMGNIQSRMAAHDWLLENIKFSK